MDTWTKDIIHPKDAKTLHGLFEIRTRKGPTLIAYRYFNNQTQNWQEYTWAEAAEQVAAWRRALRSVQLNPGDKIGLMLRNCPEWVFCEQACSAEGLISVPLYPNDRPDNVSFIVNEAEIKLILIESDAEAEIVASAESDFSHPVMLIHLENITTTFKTTECHLTSHWLKTAPDTVLTDIAETASINEQQLATIVYTSGTTGRPKGVMLSHKNILANAYGGISSVTIYQEDTFLSFLPLSHTLERTVGYYIPMMSGATVAFCRSVPQLAEDLLVIKPTVLISVPRIYERVYGKILTQLEDKPPIAQKLFNLTKKIGWQRFLHQQGRGPSSLNFVLWPILQKVVAQKVLDKLGGRLRFTISGGAPLPETVSQLFIAFGLRILQGYGLTESSPVISVNRLDADIPKSIGKALPGVNIRLDSNRELQTKSDCIMLGYWKNPQATQEVLTDDGWLRTGDLAEIVDDFIYISGRLKEILVLSNGKKVPPVDMEVAICLHPLFEQAMVVGEGKSYLSAIIVLEVEQWKKFATQLDVSADESSLQLPQVKAEVLKLMSDCLSELSGYAEIKQVTLSLQPWTDANHLLTASLKIRRATLMEQFAADIDEMYRGH